MSLAGPTPTQPHPSAVPTPQPAPPTPASPAPSAPRTVRGFRAASGTKGRWGRTVHKPPGLPTVAMEIARGFNGGCRDPKFLLPASLLPLAAFFFFKLMRETERLVVPFIHAYLLVGSCLCPDPQDPSPSYAEPLEKSLVPATPPTCCVTLVKSLGLAESISSSVKGEPPTSQGHCKNQSYLLIVWNYSQYFFIWTSSVFIGSPLTKTS